MGLLSLGYAYQDNYYYEHPGAIRKALLACPQHEPKGTSCKSLNNIAKEVSKLLFDLELNPQAFGLNILQTQTEIARQIQSTSVTNELLKNQKEVQVRLALIKLLQSPGGE